MKVFNNITQLVGNTPIVKLNKLTRDDSADIFVKLEYFNPGGSVKDRIALNMIEMAENEGILNKDSVIIEPTSGNTGIGLAMVGASKGYKIVLVMPDTMSVERRNLLKAYGSELILTSGTKGMKGAIEKAEELVNKSEKYFMPQQFKNKYNPAIHMKTTALEIIEQMDGNLDAFIAGVGTGGTITGVTKILRERISDFISVAVEPTDSPVLSGGNPGSHKIQGIGAGFIPHILDMTLIDKIETVNTDDALDTLKEIAKKEGLLVGISSGAAVFVALKIARELGKSKKVVVMAPDNGERYLSTGIFE